MKRIAVVGAGHMARSRGAAFLATGRAEICGVASRSAEHARVCAVQLGGAEWFDDFRDLESTRPDALLVETPHQAHDDIVPWAIRAGYDLLVGGNLSTTIRAGEQFIALAGQHGRLIECGYDRRYHPAWVLAREMIQSGELGRPIHAYSVGLWDADPRSWYYSQAASGGMPLTHMTYAGLSYVRWILGRPTGVSAAANRIAHPEPGLVDEENCSAVVTFESGAFATIIAGYCAPPRWPGVRTSFVCSRGGAIPDEATQTLTLHRGDVPDVLRFAPEPSSLVRQAHAFLDALQLRGGHRNPPEDALWDVRLADAIARAAREQAYVAIGSPVP